MAEMSMVLSGDGERPRELLLLSVGGGVGDRDRGLSGPFLTFLVCFSFFLSLSDMDSSDIKKERRRA